MIKIIDDGSDKIRSEIVKTFSQAFHDDPALCWIVPDSNARFRRLPRLFDWLFDDHIKRGVIHASPNAEAAAFWRLPGKVHYQDAVTIGLVWRMVEIFGLSLSRATTLSDAISEHVPLGEDYLYLRNVAVSPSHQGQGWGGRIIRSGLQYADQLGVDTCLETSNHDTVGLYERLGFTVVDEWEVPKGGPKFWTMVRKRQKS